MTHHAAAPLAMPAVLVVRRAPAGVGCRPYPCQVGRTATCCRTSRHACRTCGARDDLAVRSASVVSPINTGKRIVT
ncbi:hypothetical protein BHE74_00055306 [Ensete ventricosum]|nr:hypothetical protein BHE74_00055306 [Ensete ventricosum]